MDIADWPAVAGQAIGVRVRGVDTPEMRDSDPTLRALARQAKDLTARLCPVGSSIELRNLARDKYYRLLASVYCQGRDLGEALLRAAITAG